MVMRRRRFVMDVYNEIHGHHQICCLIYWLVVRLTSSRLKTAKFSKVKTDHFADRYTVSIVCRHLCVPTKKKNTTKTHKTMTDWLSCSQMAIDAGQERFVFPRSTVSFSFNTFCKIMFVFNCKVFSFALLLHVLIAVSMAHTSVEEAKAAKYSSVKKYHKKLKKQDGAIRLVGGSGDHEGKRNIWKSNVIVERTPLVVIDGVWSKIVKAMNWEFKTSHTKLSLKSR